MAIEASKNWDSKSRRIQDEAALDALLLLRFRDLALGVGAADVWEAACPSFWPVTWTTGAASGGCSDVCLAEVTADGFSMSSSPALSLSSAKPSLSWSGAVASGDGVQELLSNSEKHSSVVALKGEKCICQLYIVKKELKISSSASFGFSESAGKLLFRSL